jgi:hypothetical protein
MNQTRNDSGPTPERDGDRRPPDASRLESQAAVTNTGVDPHLGPGGDPAEGARDDDADAATG